jgi:hypothetical protein
MTMSRRQSRRQRQQERYHRLAIQVGQAEAAANLAADLLDDAMRTGAPLSEVRAAYQAVGAAVQEPLPAAPALDPQRPAAISSQLSTLRTRRQWYLMGAPPGVLTPAATRPNSRAPLGPHVAGLEADLAERAWGVDLDRTLDRSR